MCGFCLDSAFMRQGLPGRIATRIRPASAPLANSPEASTDRWTTRQIPGRFARSSCLLILKSRVLLASLNPTIFRLDSAVVRQDVTAHCGDLAAKPLLPAQLGTDS